MIRLARKEDGELLQDILAKDILGKQKLNARGGIGNVVENDKWNASFIDCEEDEVRGFIKISANSTDGSIYLNDMYVSSNFRRMGVATNLIKHALSYALDSWPANHYYAYTIENKPMEKLLKKFGFKNSGTYHHFIYRNRRFLSQTLFMKKI